MNVGVSRMPWLVLSFMSSTFVAFRGTLLSCFVAFRGCCMDQCGEIVVGVIRQAFRAFLGFSLGYSFGLRGDFTTTFRWLVCFSRETSSAFTVASFFPAMTWGLRAFLPMWAAVATCCGNVFQTPGRFCVFLLWSWMVLICHNDKGGVSSYQAVLLRA